ncbi:glycoside hydrolase family 43 protein [Marinifilum sp.]|uniref:glycoside hydrolase family 43 protein n=1 Tax=Marinifilum sp. TaxID=2033137 RepID=UPI003BA8FBF4
MNKIQNPIISGFNPDPSIIRVEDDYYIANSTFEWFPGVQIYHSKDLKNWRLIGQALTTTKLLEMRGAPNSCGVWAPCLTYNDGTFYLIYTNVKTFDGVWKDTPNYLTTTNDIESGEWTDPVYLNSNGFDGSLFHDDDGKKYLLNMLVDHRGGKFFGGIQIQEYDPVKQVLVGEIKNIFEGSELGITEGPHIYKRNGYYYLMTAEGGTEYGHAVTLCRSKNLLGPYELHPNNPVVTSKNNPDIPIQKPGHADIVETQNGEWYMVHLGGRPLSKLGRCTLGRETCIQKVEWREDNWLYLSEGGNEPFEKVPMPNLPEHEFGSLPETDDFDCKKLDVNYSSLRVPIRHDWANLEERPGFLRLYGRESLCSFFTQSLIARRVQAFNIEASTCMEFSPDNFQQMAGLVFYYNTMHMYYLNVSFHEDIQKKYLQIIAGDNGNFSEPLNQAIDITGVDRIYLKGHMNRTELQFYYSFNGDEWAAIGPVLDASILSDDYVRDNGLHYRAAFTGAFVGMCCQDLTGSGKYADFDWFRYVEK